MKKTEELSVQNAPLPALPKCWSDLSWQQLCQCWEVKIRYGSNADVARVAALLALIGIGAVEGIDGFEAPDGEPLFLLVPNGNSQLSSGASKPSKAAAFIVTPRELAQLAKQALPWFDYPYGDSGASKASELSESSESSKASKPSREPVAGYVSDMRDAMMLPIDELKVDGILFEMPQHACVNITWEQYRALQRLAPELFREGITEEEALDLQAQFLANCLVPAQKAQQTGDRFGAKHVFNYDSRRAERTVPFWKKQLTSGLSKPSKPSKTSGQVLFHICFQVYQTAVAYYAAVYPLLFSGGGKSDPLQDAITGEMGTINAVMMKANYSSQQEVYDSNLPFILDILNTMAKEAKEIEKMNAKIKSKH